MDTYLDAALLGLLREHSGPLSDFVRILEVRSSRGTNMLGKRVQRKAQLFVQGFVRVRNS
jgi:hypothetical protein